VSDGRPFTLRMFPTDHVSSVTIGIKSPVSASPSLCIVLAHQWPGWLSCLSSYNFCCTHLFCETPQAPWIIHLASAYPGCSILDLRTTPPGSIVPPTDHRVFFQGTASLLSWLHPNVSNCVMGALDSSRETVWLPDWFSTTLSYFLYGGVTNGNWVFVCNRPFDVPLPHGDLRTLRHVIDQTRRVTKFTPAPASSHNTPDELCCVRDDTGTLEWFGL